MWILTEGKSASLAVGRAKVWEKMHRKWLVGTEGALLTYCLMLSQSLTNQGDYSHVPPHKHHHHCRIDLSNVALVTVITNKCVIFLI